MFPSPCGRAHGRLHAGHTRARHGEEPGGGEGGGLTVTQKPHRPLFSQRTGGEGTTVGRLAKRSAGTVRREGRREKEKQKRRETRWRDGSAGERREGDSVFLTETAFVSGRREGFGRRTCARPIVGGVYFEGAEGGAVSGVGVARAVGAAVARPVLIAAICAEATRR